jgi:hypothetical protein
MRRKDYISEVSVFHQENSPFIGYALSMNI